MDDSKEAGTATPIKIGDAELTSQIPSGWRSLQKGQAYLLVTVCSRAITFFSTLPSIALVILIGFKIGLEFYFSIMFTETTLLKVVKIVLFFGVAGGLSIIISIMVSLMADILSYPSYPLLRITVARIVRECQYHLGLGWFTAKRILIVIASVFAMIALISFCYIIFGDINDDIDTEELVYKNVAYGWSIILVITWILSGFFASAALVLNWQDESFIIRDRDVWEWAVVILRCYHLIIFCISVPVCMFIYSPYGLFTIYDSITIVWVLLGFLCTITFVFFRLIALTLLAVRKNSLLTCFVFSLVMGGCTIVSYLVYQSSLVTFIISSMMFVFVVYCQYWYYRLPDDRDTSFPLRRTTSLITKGALTVIFLSVIVLLCTSLFQQNIHPITDLSAFDLSYQAVTSNNDTCVDEHHFSITTLGRADAKIIISNQTPVIDDRLRYAFCKYDTHDMQLHDFGLLAQLSYFDLEKDEAAKQFLSVLFPTFAVHKTGTMPGTDHTLFYHFLSSEKNISVISIRGTQLALFTDWIQDVDIWVEIGTIKIFSMFFPGLNLWSVKLLDYLVELVASIERVYPHHCRRYYFPIIDYINSIPEDHGLVIVGHSLGGGLAKIAGAATARRSIAYSSPGLVESASKLNLTEEQLSASAINVLSSLDIVPTFGTTSGTIAKIPCVEGSPDLCHHPMYSICFLMNSCGIRHRNHTIECDFRVHSMSGKWAVSPLTRVFPFMVTAFVLCGFCVGFLVLRSRLNDEPVVATVSADKKNE